MTIAGSDIEFKSFLFQSFLYSLQKDGRIGRTDLIGAVIQNGTILVFGILLGKCYKITAERHIIRLHVHANAECFQRRSACVIFPRVISRHCKIRRIASGCHSNRNHSRNPLLGLRRKRVHSRRSRSFQRRFLLQFFQRFTRHTIT